MEAAVGSTIWEHDRGLFGESRWLVGVDEAGRGALAGPVVAGACVVGEALFGDPEAAARCAAINDSKQLTGTARESLYAVLGELRTAGALDLATGEASVAEIDELNILGATRLAMRRALEALAGRARGWRLVDAASAGPLFPSGDGAARILVDGRPLKPFPYVHSALTGGDGRSFCIAAASIAAKVERDRLMAALDVRHPGYGIAAHKGYGTEMHRRALRENGPSPVHRRFFLRKLLKPSR